MKRIRQAREFWKGAQYLFFDQQNQRWKIPGSDKLSSKEKDLLPRYEFVTNIYQAFGLTLISILTQGNPITRWMPVDPENASDTATAKAASDVAELFRRNNPTSDLLQDLMFYFFNDGGCAGYVRYVADELKYGVDEKPRTTLIEKPGEMMATCPTCGWQGPLPPLGVEGTAACPQCQLPIPPDAIRQGEPVSVTAPAIDPQTGQQIIDRTPRGQEVLELVSFLNLVLPVYAQEQDQYPFLTYSGYFHRARLIATYPWIEEKLAGSGGGDGGDAAGSTAQAYEKQTNVGLLESSSTGSRLGSELSQALLPLRRTWFRPWALSAVKDKGLRAELLAQYPKGVKVAFCGDTFCEAGEEEMDKHWRVVHAFPGEGQNREAVGGTLIPVQQQYNGLANIAYETAEYGIPATFMNPETVNLDAYKEAGALPGLTFPALPPDGKPMAESFHQTEPAVLSQHIPHYQGELRGEVAQFLCGAFPALFGGDTGSNDTASGISQQRDQALGRIGMLWRKTVSFLAHCDQMGVENFRDSRPDDVKLALLGPAGTLDSKLIRLADLEGNFRAYPDPTEVYPITFEKRRAAIEKLGESANPAIQGVFNKPGNLETWLRYEGFSQEIEIPGAAERDAELRVIARLLVEGPGSMPMLDPIMDDLPVIVATIREWAVSDAGQETREKNQQAWGLVRERLKQCAQAIQMQQQAQAAQQGPPGGGAPDQEAGSQPVQ